MVARFGVVPPRTATGLRAFRRDPLAALEAAAADGEEVVRRRAGPLRVAMATTPAAATELLVANAGALDKGLGLERARLLIGDGLLTAGTPVHDAHLAEVRPALRRGAVAGHAGRMAALAGACAARLPEGEPADLAAESARLALATAGLTLFGADLDAHAADVGGALAEALDFFDRPSLLVTDLAARLPLPAGRRFRAARGRLDATVAGLVAGRVAGAPGDDLLGRLIRAREAGRLDDRAVRDEVLTLLLAGHETVANALAWALALLAHDPAAQTRLHAEVDAVLGGRPPGAADLAHLPWTRAVLLEAMRLYPPAWLIGRRVRRPVVVRGTPLAPGTLALVPLWVLHRDPRAVPEPGRFLPGRFVAGDDPPPPGPGYLPFGAGPRRCVGQAFALQEGVIALATLAARREFRPAGPMPRPLPRITLRPEGGMPLLAVPRAAGLRASRRDDQRPPR